MKTGYAMDMVHLTEEERGLFNDPPIEAAFQAWAGEMVKKNVTLNLRKQFLLRIRALLQSGQL